MKKWTKKRFVIIPIVFLAIALLGKISLPYLVWLPAMNISQTLLGWWPASWKEEVLLHDGRTIIVKRSQTRGGRHEIGQDVPVNKHTLSFTLPGSGKRITWQTTFGPKLEDTELQPLALDIVRDIPYLVTTPIGCIAYNKWKRPNPPYVLFKYKENIWQQITLDELPAQIKRANMVNDNLQLKRESKLLGHLGSVSYKEINRINGEFKHKDVEYLTEIFRNHFQAGSNGVSCEQLVYYKCGWGAPGDFTRNFFDKICK